MENRETPDYVGRCVDAISSRKGRWITDLSLITMVLGGLWLGTHHGGSGTELTGSISIDGISTGSISHWDCPARLVSARATRYETSDC